MNTVEDIIQYACFELTRSKNENLLKGKNFCEYAKAFTYLFENREKLMLMEAEAGVRAKKVIDNREEIEIFMKIIHEAIIEVIEDLHIRKKLSDTIDMLYDKYYPDPPAESKPYPTNDPS